jgi:ATPase family associated with various cellular activities (AAA)
MPEGSVIKPVVIIATVVRDEIWRAQIDAFCQELCDQLADLQGIELVNSRPVEANTAATIRITTGQEVIVVVVGEGALLQNSVNLLAPLCHSVPPIPIAFDSGEATLKIMNASLANIIDMVCSAARALEHEAEWTRLSTLGQRPPAPGTIISLDSWRDSVSNPLKGSSNQYRSAYTPSSATNSVNSSLIGGGFTTALDWVDAAMDALSDLWSLRGGVGNGIFGLSWDELLASVERMRAVGDTFGEAAHEKFRMVQAMIAHPSAADTPLVKLARQLDLNEVAIKLLLIVIAPELDIRYQRMFGALQDDMGRRHASLGLVCAVLAATTDKATPKQMRSRIAGLDGLRSLRLIDGIGAKLAAADEPLRIDSQVLDWLVTGEARLLKGDVSREGVVQASPRAAMQILPQPRLRAVSAAVFNDEAVEALAIILTGSTPGWIEVEAHALAGNGIGVAPPHGEIPDDRIEALAHEVVRAARLLGQPLVVNMLNPPLSGKTFWCALAALLKTCATPPFVLTENPGQLLTWANNDRMVVIDLPPVGQEERTEAIRIAITTSAPDADLSCAGDLAERFRIPLVCLSDCIPMARAAAAKSNVAQPGRDEWHSAFRALAGIHLPQLARRVTPIAAPVGKSPLDRIVLPKAQRQQLEMVLNHVRVGGKVLRDWQFGAAFDACGVSALFAGESGTGKTSAAHAIASALGTDLYVIDLAKIVSKYIGETEKNLDLVFDEAERAGAVLLFDEADALFGKRSAVSDAHDRYANIEVAYLLQRMEQFDGLAILTSNHPRNIDPAFGRRLRFTVEFPFPDARDRLTIWEQALPMNSAHRGANIDFGLAARRLEFNGGSIRQVLLHALMAAGDTADGLVIARHLEDAARTEAVRLGKYDRLDGMGGLFDAAIRQAA